MSYLKFAHLLGLKKKASEEEDDDKEKAKSEIPSRGRGAR